MLGFLKQIQGKMNTKSKKDKTPNKGQLLLLPELKAPIFAKPKTIEAHQDITLSAGKRFSYYEPRTNFVIVGRQEALPPRILASNIYMHDTIKSTFASTEPLEKASSLMVSFSLKKLQGEISSSPNNLQAMVVSNYKGVSVYQSNNLQVMVLSNGGGVSVYHNSLSMQLDKLEKVTKTKANTEKILKIEKLRRQIAEKNLKATKRAAVKAEQDRLFAETKWGNARSITYTAEIKLRGAKIEEYKITQHWAAVRKDELITKGYGGGYSHYSGCYECYGSFFDSVMASIQMERESTKALREKAEELVTTSKQEDSKARAKFIEEEQKAETAKAGQKLAQDEFDVTNRKISNLEAQYKLDTSDFNRAFSALETKHKLAITENIHAESALANILLPTNSNEIILLSEFSLDELHTEVYGQVSQNPHYEAF